MRIGINIPNELHRRLKPLKEYINISQICREAIEERTRCYEKALASRHDQDVAKAIERVWEEEREMRAVLDVDWGALGCEDAKSWVTTARLKDWEVLHHRQELFRERYGRPRWEVPPLHMWEDLSAEMKDFKTRMHELDDRIRKQGDQFLEWLYDEHGGIDREAAEREYMSAWTVYTDAVWGLYSKLREEYHEERLRARLEVARGRPRPTVPKNLLDELNEGAGQSS